MPDENIAKTELRSLDGLIYRKFISMNITTVWKARNLSSTARVEMEKEIGLPYLDSERVFLLFDSHIRAYNKCNYKLLYDPGPCDRALVSTIIVVHSLPLSAKRRITLRRRLKRFRRNGYRTVFLIGRTASLPEHDLRREAFTYDDIIWADFEEDYDNLTIKTLTMLRWVEKNCKSANHLVKVDDDVHLHMVNLDAALKVSSSASRAVIGSISFNETPFREFGEKWYLPRYMYDKELLPNFAHGPCYVLTTDLLPELNRVAVKVSYVHLEDIFVAICTTFLKDVHHVDIPQFISKNCSYTEVVATHNSECS